MEIIYDDILYDKTRSKEGKAPKNKLIKKYDYLKMYISAIKNIMFSKKYEVKEIDKNLYKEFLWEALFAKTLPFSEADHIFKSDFFLLNVSWDILHKVGLRIGKYPILDTEGYDFFLTQTPTPLRVSKGTKILVRYHDAIPVFFPHTINNSQFHQASHYRALLDNINNDALFICSSQATQDNLLKIAPEAEDKSYVIHDIVSDDYYPEEINDDYLLNIIISRINRFTEPKFNNFI